MEKRQHGEQHRRWRDIGGTAEIDAIPECHAMGDDGALGLARGARGVHDGRDVIERHLLRPIQRRGGCDRRLIGAVRPQSKRRRDLAQAADFAGDVGEIGVVDHQLRCGIGDDELQLRDGQTGIQRQEHRADTATGKLHLQRIGGVHGQHRDAVAARDSGRLAQIRGETGNARVELRVGEAPIAGEVDSRQFAGRPPGEMGDPVVVTNRQTLLRGQRSLRRLCCPCPVWPTNMPNSGRIGQPRFWG